MAYGKKAHEAMEKRRGDIERMRRLDPAISNLELAERLGVEVGTIKNDLAAMERSGTNARKYRGMSQRERDVIFDEEFSTYSMVDGMLRRTDEAHREMFEALGYSGETCECCGRKPLAENPLQHQNFAKLGDTFARQLELRAKIRGEVIDNLVFTVQQIDADTTAIMAAIASIREVTVRDLVENDSFVNPDGSVNVAAVTEALVRQIRNTLASASVRRHQRLPAAVDIITDPQRYL